MGISTIRRYEEEDKARVKAAAERFRIDEWIYDSHPQDKAYRRKLWTACYCRALRVPCDVRTTTGYGYIGINVD